MKINPAFLFERVGNQVVVLDSKTQTVIAVSDDSARVLSDLRNGVEVSSDAPGMAELIDQGIVLPASTSQLSRRSLVVAGGAVGAGSVLALGLPAAADASSPVAIPAPQIVVTGGFAGGYEFFGSSSPANPTAVDSLFGIDIENEDDYDRVQTTFFWGFTAGGNLFAFDDEDFPELIWDADGDKDAAPIPPEALDEDANLTIFVFARVDGVLSLPAEVLLEPDN